MEKTKSCLLLGLILKKILRKQYSQGFTTLHTNAKNIKEMVFKNIMQNNKRLQQQRQQQQKKSLALSNIF